MTTSNEQMIAGGAGVIQRLSQEMTLRGSNAPKRVFLEVTRAWPGDAKRLWWKWLSEAAREVGRRNKTLDCTIEEAVSLASDHAQVVCYRENEAAPNGEWLCILGAEGRKFRVFTQGAYKTEQLLSKSELESRLQLFLGNVPSSGKNQPPPPQEKPGENVEGSETDGTNREIEDSRPSEPTVRCVVLQPEQAWGQPNGASPWRRMWALMRPEASDLWVVIIFAFVVSLLMLATPMAVEALVNTVAFGRFLQPIVMLAAILLTFLGFQGAIRALQTFVVEIIQRRLFARIAGDLSYRLPRVEPEGFDGQHAPELVNRFFDIVSVQKIVAQLFLDGLSLTLGTVIGMAVLGFYHPWLLGFDLFLISAIAVIVVVLGRGAVPSAIKESKHKYYMAAWLEDIASCPAAFRTEGGAEFAVDRADHLVHGYLTARKRHFRIVIRQVLFALSLQAIASTVLLGLGGWLVVAGELTLGQLVAAELIVTTVVGSFAKLGKHMESFYDLMASVDKLGALFDLPPTRDDGVFGVERNEPCEAICEAVTYRWSGGGAIKAVNATFRTGSRNAIFGDAGSGKSTLLELIAGMRPPSGGHVTLDGFDPRDMNPEALRSRVALARRGEVFHATIEENVHMQRDHVTATDVRDTLSQIGLLEATQRLKDGCDTMLTSGGRPLSDSQCDILSIARATAGRPKLLLIDGVLDGLSQHDLENCLSYLLDENRPWTLVVATSRQDIANLFANRVDLSEPIVLKS